MFGGLLAGRWADCTMRLFSVLQRVARPHSHPCFEKLMKKSWFPSSPFPFPACDLGLLDVPVGIAAFTARDVPYPASTRRPGSGLRRPSAGTGCQPEGPRLPAAPAGNAGLHACRGREGRPWDDECISLLPGSEGVLNLLPGSPVSAPHPLS